MSRSLRWIWVLILLPLLYSCDDKLEFEVKTAAPRMVVNSIFGQDSLIQIEISTTARPGDGSSIRSLTDARIFLTEDGVAISDFVLDSALTTPWYMMGEENPKGKKLYFFRTEFTKARAGREYHIEVTHQNYTTVVASSKIPRATRARVLPSRVNSNLLLDGQSFAEISFEIQDDGKENFYALELMAVKEKKAPMEKLSFYSTDKAFSQNYTQSNDHSGQGAYYLTNGGVYFSNDKFQGKKREFTIYIDADVLTRSESVELRILSLSDSFYKFATSWQQQRNNVGDPFAQPVPVYTNIQNGLGIFAGYSVSTLVLQ